MAVFTIASNFRYVFLEVFTSFIISLEKEAYETINTLIVLLRDIYLAGNRQYRSIGINTGITLINSSIKVVRIVCLNN